ncbi:pilus assembly protein [Paenibacillus oenotherae]|uniref:Pilus assembly protein n=1 Tax=Paenibacillus oenotherae TaxID=1435645 RepID=A0ABS7D9D2_9BACL|nr:TadE family protein [Paenibacillus oenotherae]MBW7476552.1 pilus assembly protein [Paenibacillus oenotherae]
MRRRRQWDGRTVKERSDAGSIALEASLIMPIVLMVILFFICLIQLCAAQMALHGAVSQTAKQAAANIRPIELAVQQAAGYMPSHIGGLPTVEVPQEIRSIAAELADWLPPPAGPLMSAAIKGDWKPLEDVAATAIGRSIVEPLLQHQGDDKVLDVTQLKLSVLSLPDLKGGAEPYIRIEAEYTFRLALPFTKHSVKLREQAVERVWVSDATPAPRGGIGDAGADERTSIQIVSIEPDPLRPGRRAAVTVQSEPGQKLNLTVQYKSGQSRAKNLGEATTDGEGIVEWSWLVSGNTTPGVWELIVTAEDGTKVARHFVVESSGITN